MNGYNLNDIEPLEGDSQLNHPRPCTKIAAMTTSFTYLSRPASVAYAVS